MATAGRSARREAERSEATIEAHLAAIEAERERARNFMIAAQTEHQTAVALAPLAAAGYVLLADRRWPGSRSAQVDLVVIGPSGVWIVDTKAWREMSIAAGRVYRGDEDVTETFENLESLGETTRSALVEIGLAPAEVHVLVVWSGKSVSATVGGVEVVGSKNALAHIVRAGARLPDAAIDASLRAAMDLFPPLSPPPPVNVTIASPVLPAEPLELEILELPTPAEVEASIMQSLTAAPIEEWMAFVHPDQARLIRRSFSGPSRIRGAAGTGKTVVGLHRAAHLARTRPDGNVLVTTFVKTLPQVLKTLLARLAPDVVDRVEFRGVHEFAATVLHDRGVRVRTDGRRAGDVFKQTWAGESGRRLAAIEDNEQYWREEVENVIKGRGFTDFEQYASCPRPGRRRILGAIQRRDVWSFYWAYEQGLRAAGINDFADLVLLAEAELRREPRTGYTAVIVDEAQDLSLAMVRMLLGLVGDGVDAFTLIGDGQQSIYPGGYALAEAGISVAGRGVVLEVNYRNTAEILARAELVVAGDQYADIEGGDVAAVVAMQPAARHGEHPIGRVFTTRVEHNAALVERIRRVTEAIDTGLGDVGVLCTSNAHAKAMVALLEHEGIPTIDLLAYTGAQVDRVKIGTINRAKGLEFKQVLLPLTRSSLLTSGAARSEGIAESMLEREERDRRVLFVGMTRARDGLWVGAVAGR